MARLKLPNYNSFHHIKENSTGSFQFLSTLNNNSVIKVAVAGTCAEHGMQIGCMSASTVSMPTRPYAIAKDSLRRFLEALAQSGGFSLVWLRIFNVYCKRLNSGSLLQMLDRAIDNDEAGFRMSLGEQL